MAYRNEKRNSPPQGMGNSGSIRRTYGICGLRQLLYEHHRGCAGNVVEGFGEDGGRASQIVARG